MRADGHPGPRGSAGIRPLPHQRGRSAPSPGWIQGAGSTTEPTAEAVPTLGRQGCGRAALGGRTGCEPRLPCYAGQLVRPLWPHEYLNSVVMDPDVTVHSRRLGWESPLHFNNPTYISTHYSQVSAPWPWAAAQPTLAPRPSPHGREASQPPSPQGEGKVAGPGGGFRAQLPRHCPAISGAAGLPAGEAVAQFPRRHPSRQAGRPTAPQQGPQGPPVRVSVSLAPHLPSLLLCLLVQIHLSTHPTGLSFSPSSSKVKAAPPVLHLALTRRAWGSGGCVHLLSPQTRQGGPRLTCVSGSSLGWPPVHLLSTCCMPSRDGPRCVLGKTCWLPCRSRCNGR